VGVKNRVSNYGITPSPYPLPPGEGEFQENPIRAIRNLPYFSRSQLGIILLLGQRCWACTPGEPISSSPPPLPPGTLSLAFVEVTGKVPHPGVYAFPKPPTLGEVRAKAGAVGTPCDPDETIASGSRVEVTPEGGYRVTAMSGAQLLTLGLRIDLNRATAEDLAAIPGLGPALAQRIINYRQAHGPFNKIEDLSEVSGIGPQNLQKLKPYLGLGSPEAIAPPDWKRPRPPKNPGPGPKLTARKDGCLGVTGTSSPRPRAALLIPTELPKQTWKPCRASVRCWPEGSLTTARATALIKKSLT